MKISEALNHAIYKLLATNNRNAQLDAETILTFTLNISRTELFLLNNQSVDSLTYNRYMQLIDRRLANEPVAYIIGEKEFWSLPFKVNAHTLIPRSDSETIIEFVLQEFTNRDENYNILDLGTGCGCLGLTLLSEFKNSIGTLCDISPLALEVTKFNAHNLGIKNPVTIIKSSWFENITPQKFDIIICNPPYIAENESLMPDVELYEPKSALYAKENGFEQYYSITRNLRNYMIPNSIAFFEIGAGQENHLVEYFNESGFIVVGIKKDIAGITRVIAIQSA